MTASRYASCANDDRIFNRGFHHPPSIGYDGAGAFRDAIVIAQTRGIGLIVGPGCVLPQDTPDANVAAVVQALGGPLKKIPGVAT